MNLSYNLTIEQAQKLTMTPELIQAIHILQYNSQELEEYVQDELVQNPLLEYDNRTEPEDEEMPGTESETAMDTEQHDFDIQEKASEVEYDDISYNQWQHHSNSEEVQFEQFVSKEETLEDFLLMQLAFSSLKGERAKIGRYLVEAIDDNGYLTVDTETVAAFYSKEPEEIEDILDVIQTFEPYGVGARSIEECLIIQLAQKGMLEDKIEYIILHHLHDIGENKLQKVAKETCLSISQVQMICDLIKTLEPKPGRKFSNGEAPKYILPDVSVENEKGKLVVYSNDTTFPKLMLSSYYTSLTAQAKEDEELNKYLTDKYNSAMWLIRSIEQRKQTIYNVACAIVRHQNDFFLFGTKSLKTLTLKDIAEDLGIHESTVSRSINGKYMQTPMGVFEFRYFFSSGVQGETGSSMSSNSIKSYIKEIIDDEDPVKPYSDQDIAEILAGKGIQISRRTVAKYREAMNIMSSSKRRRY